ncbi:Ig-like domain-containing protein [Flavobacterium collinsii]|uniref:DUF11 domain-containing protein n=1 Tax=Flavobacterium collinsii TaxID=1114861 RepID=A0A9W4TH48_9FLAO|nr:gliding motility-associated C-terminal domain-containing protein [Flavobacterium collinsii]CAI2767912.1 conserved exported protein of unknown function [Flavobacterium collinsii]
MITNIRLFRLLFILLCVLPIAVQAQYNLRATATAASCFGGSITITADNVSGDITYYIYNDVDYLESSSNVISNVNPGDYFYGFFKNDFTEYDESIEKITVGSSPCTGVGITAVSEDASCPGSGKITVSITNLPGTITYAIAKMPYLEANVITSSSPVFANLDVGNYVYGYYDGTTFIKSPATISIAASYSTSSPTIRNVAARNYTYCPGDSPSFGEITGIVGGGNSIYTVTLTKVSDNSEVSSVVGCNGCSFSFKNVFPGDYNLKAVDRCGTVVFYPVVVNLPANVPVPANSVINFTAAFPKGTIVYNDPANPCSGIRKATIKLTDLVSITAFRDGSAYFENITPSFAFGFTPKFVYKLEIQNGSNWEVYDNLSWSNPDLSTNFDLPADRSKWGLVRLTASACGVSKTLTLFYGSSSFGKDFPFDTASFYFLNDPAYKDCASTGKVRLDVRPGGGCGPYTLEVTEMDSGTITTYSSGSTFDALLSVGKTYNFKITDAKGVEPPIYIYQNNTTSAVKQPILNNAKNILIDPAYFTPATKDRRGSVLFYKGPSGKYFGKSALMAKIIYRDPAFPASSGLEGTATITLESGPSTLDINKDQYGRFGLGNNLAPGTYKIRVQDSDCFNELYDVVLDSYFTNVELTTVSSVPSITDCDRYVKSAKVNVSYVGNAMADKELMEFYTADYLFYVRTVTGPVISSANDEAYPMYDYRKNAIRGGISNMVYAPEVAGNYVIGLYTAFEGVAKPITAPLEVKSNFPVFDLKASGGIVCTGNTTGDLYVKVDNVDGTETYFIKKDTDAVFPATGQQSSIFTGLTAGNYVVKVKIGCYEVEQPLTLRPPLNNLVSGTPSFCEGGSLSLTLAPTVPLSSVNWTAPNGKVYNTRDLKLDNLTTTDAGVYKVEANTQGGCNFFEFVTVTMNQVQEPTGAANQEFCKADNVTVASLTTNETGVIWYDATTGGNIIASTTVLENNKVYYGSLKAGICESPTRLAVTVTLSDPQTPTGIATQEFCKIDNKKVSDLVTTESGVIWYDAATAGNIIVSTTALENNKVYYGSLKIGTCESPTRLAVTVTLSDPQTPTGIATQEFCKASNATVSDLVTTESGVIWYDAAIAGNIIASTTVLENNKVYYGSLKAGICESPTRLAVTVTLSDPQTPTGTVTQEFCKASNATVSDLVTTESGVIWYDAATAGNIIALTTVLENNKVYYGSLKIGTCESPTRLAVTVTLSDPQTPTGIATQEFCKASNATVADLVTTESGVTWYDAATAGTAIASTTALENNKVYYGSLKAGTCESPTRLAVTVTLSDPQTPTGIATQKFCKASNATVADLVTTESGVTWYDAATAGTAIASTTALENNKVYYGSLKIGTCESPTRLAVTVTLSDPQTPIGIATQKFCKASNATVADLVTTESGVTWYDAATAGTAIASTTVLENNKVYYGSLKIGTCESPTRLAVTVTLSDPQTPIGIATQKFCKASNATVADLVTTESGVTWYDAATAGTAIASTTALENNKVYYGSLKTGTCESSTRLAVTVTLSDPQTPTGPAKQEFCKVNNNTVADLATTESGVTWYDAVTGGNIIASTSVLENNKIYYGSLKAGNCESAIRFAVKVILKSDLTEPAPNWNSVAYISDKITYSLLDGMSSYNWLVSKEGTIVAGGQPTDNYITVEWNSAGKATIQADYMDFSKCNPLVSVNFSVTVNPFSGTVSSDIGLKKTVDNTTPDVGQQVVFTITAENLRTNEVKDIIISEKLPSGYEYVTSKVSSGNYNAGSGIWTLPALQIHEDQTLAIIAKVKGSGDYLNIAYLKASNPVDSNEANNRAEASVTAQGVIVYNAISPDGDGLNDYFKIDGLDRYPNNTVEIFNRGGVQIFKTSNYGSNANVFRGISEGRVTIDKQRGVPTGTYFYVLRYEAHGTMNEKSGYLYVKN